MYIPRHFEVKDTNEILKFIKANAFGQIVSNVHGRLFSTHMPFLLNPKGTHLFGHFAKQNPQHADIEGQKF